MAESSKTTPPPPLRNFRSECSVSKLHLLFIIFLKIDGAGAKELMKQPPNCKGHWCVESYKLAGTYGKLPSTFKVSSFINSC